MKATTTPLIFAQTPRQNKVAREAIKAELQAEQTKRAKDLAEQNAIILRADQALEAKRNYKGCSSAYRQKLTELYRKTRDEAIQTRYLYSKRSAFHYIKPAKTPKWKRATELFGRDYSAQLDAQLYAIITDHDLSIHPYQIGSWRLVMGGVPFKHTYHESRPTAWSNGWSCDAAAAKKLSETVNWYGDKVPMREFIRSGNWLLHIDGEKVTALQLPGRQAGNKHMPARLRLRANFVQRLELFRHGYAVY